jgi:hypothetical protein
VNFHSQGLHSLVGRAPVADPDGVWAPLLFGPAGHDEPTLGDDGPPPRRIPPHDILVIGSRPSPPVEEASPVRVVPRISRQRLVVRLLLVTALIAESVFAVRTWPSKPIPVPDASAPGSMIA